MFCKTIPLVFNLVFRTLGRQPGSGNAEWVAEGCICEAGVAVQERPSGGGYRGCYVFDELEVQVQDMHDARRAEEKKKSHLESPNKRQSPTPTDHGWVCGVMHPTGPEHHARWSEQIRRAVAVGQSSSAVHAAFYNAAQLRPIDGGDGHGADVVGFPKAFRALKSSAPGTEWPVRRAACANQRPAFTTSVLLHRRVVAVLTLLGWKDESGL